jgi:hypothetical protein
LFKCSPHYRTRWHQGEEPVECWTILKSFKDRSRIVRWIGPVQRSVCAISHREAPRGRRCGKALIQLFDIGLEDRLAFRRGVLLPKARGIFGKPRKSIENPANEDEV